MEQLKAYIPFVDFLGKALGPRCEVVLHDLREPEHSIIAIANGGLSGRAIGGPVTDFLLKLLKRSENENTDFFTNYCGKGSGAGQDKLFRSSSYFIKDAQGRNIGAICINLDVRPFLEARNFLEQELAGIMQLGPQLHEPAAEPGLAANQSFENLHGTIEDVICGMIDARLQAYPVEPNRLSVDERLELVHRLNNDGLFLLKGGIGALADKIEVSEPTVYRYLSRIKKEK